MINKVISHQFAGKTEDNSQFQQTLPTSSVSSEPSECSAMAKPQGGCSNDSFLKPASDLQILQQHQYPRSALMLFDNVSGQQNSQGRFPSGYYLPPVDVMIGGQQDLTMAVPRPYTFYQNFYGSFNSETDPPRRKRGRPRKNPLKEPSTTKRKYVRKRKPVPGSAVSNHLEDAPSLVPLSEEKREKFQGVFECMNL